VENKTPTPQRFTQRKKEKRNQEAADPKKKVFTGRKKKILTGLEIGRSTGCHCSGIKAVAIREYVDKKDNPGAWTEVIFHNIQLTEDSNSQQPQWAVAMYTDNR
jgi:hypothetical protein